MRTAQLANCFLVAALFAPPSSAQVLNDPAAAAYNTAWLQQQLDAGHEFWIPDGTLYVEGTAQTPPTQACARIRTHGAGGYSSVPTPDLKQIACRIVQRGQGPILRIRGVGAILADPIEFVGDGVSAAIEIEGRTRPATGEHRFANLVFRDWGAAFRALGGYYDDAGHFVADEQHADNCSVSDCQACRCRRLFWSQNQQALNWYFTRCSLHWDLEPPQPMVAFDLERGGKIHCDGLEWCTNLATLFRVRDFSPNQSWLTCRNLSYDRMIAADSYLCLFDYAGRPEDANFARWKLAIDGYISQPLPLDRIFKVPPDLPRDQWSIDIGGAYDQVHWPPAKLPK